MEFAGEAESVTTIVNELFPAVEGAPEITPLSRESPAGRLDPDLTAKEYGAMPPLTVDERS